MGTSTPIQQPINRSREIRLGLVMYGGISLAIYINGVAREFYRAVRGESIYKLIKAFTDSDIVVDIVSGSSAGGVNGVLLGYALCNKADFATTAELWRKAGDIGVLVRDPEKLGEPVLSVLDGEGHYQSVLQGAFGRMDGGWVDEDIEPSQLTEMDVFITSTDVDGRGYNWIDAQGHLVDVKDHRAVFQLKYREGRKNDFAPDASRNKHGALAKLSRMTSCFPAAFPPVRVVVNPQLTNEAERKYWAQWKQIDGLIAGWGNLTKDDSYFLDGGLLDNKPFTYTTREIFYRLADRKVERKLFYVEPDPETFEHNPAATQVNVIQAVQRALISIPGYESIADDLKLLSAHNEKIERYERMIGLGRDRKGLQLAAKRARAALDLESKNFIARIHALESGGERPAVAMETPSRYAKARFVTLSERAVRGILKSHAQEPKLDPTEKAAAGKLYRMFDAWDDPRDPNGDLTLYHFDVYFRLRRIFHVLYACTDPGMEATEADELRGQVLRAIGRQIRLLEILRAAMEKLVDDGDFRWRQRDPQQIWGLLLAAYQQLLNAVEIEALLPPGYTDDWTIDAPQDSWLNQAGLDLVYQCLFGGKSAGVPVGNGRIDRLIAQLPSDSGIAPPTTFVNVLTLTDACERRMLRYFDGVASTLPDHAGLPMLEKTYDDFLFIDADLFTVQAFADLQEKDIINTVRISPRDAQRAFCALDLKRKVAGDAVFHFGGFFKKSWRANDILWGRLDGLCQLTEALLERTRVIEVLNNDARRAVLQADIRPGGKLHPATLFPKALPKTQQELFAWFQGLVDNDPVIRGAASADREWEEHLDLLVEAAQMEFLGDELKNVLEDSVAEQMGWNLYRKTAGSLEDVDRRGAKTKGGFTVGKGRFDPTVHALAAAAISERAMATLDNPASLKEFFIKEYGVGAESIAKDVPLWVLLEILFRALLVAKASLLHAMPPKWRDKVRGSPLFKIASAALWLFYGLASTLRSSSRILLVWRSVVFGLALLSWCVALFWGADLVCASNNVNKWAVALLFVPTVLLFGSFRKLWGWAIFLAVIGLAMAIFGSPLCKWLMPG